MECAVFCARTSWNVEEEDVELWLWFSVCVYYKGGMSVKGGIVSTQLCVNSNVREEELV